MSKSLDPDQVQHNVESVLGLNCCKGYQQTTKATIRLVRGETETLIPHIEAPFDAFANRADPDQAALIRAA